MENCNHICSGNCRRVGCNCDCGEWHKEGNFGVELEKIKHVGTWKDGKLVCNDDCPSITHKK